MKKYRYLIPPLVTFIILGIIFYINGLYPFGANPLVQVDADYIYIPTLYKLWDFLHKGSSILYTGIGLGNSIFGSLVIQTSLFSPLNLILLFVKRESLVEFMGLFIIIKMCLISLTSYIYIDKRHKVNLFYKVLFSVLYTFSGFMILNYFNDIWLDLVILFPLVVYYLEEMINNGKCTGYIITLSLCFIISIYYSVFIIIFILFYTFIYLNLFSKKIKESIFLLGKSTVIALLISSFSSIPALYQILSSGRFNDVGSTGLFSNISMKSLYLLLSPLYIIYFIKLILKYKTNKKIIYSYTVIFLLYLIPVLVDPINISLHGGSFWSFPYRYGYITSFILMNGSLFYISNYEKNNKVKINYIDITYIVIIIFFIGLGLNINLSNVKTIIDEGILLEISNNIYIKIIYIVLITFIIYIIALLIKNTKTKYILLALASLYSIYLFTTWTIYFNSGYFLCTNAMNVYNNLELPKDGRYKVEYTTYTPDYGLIFDVDTLDNWLHILPNNMVNFYSKLGYYTSGTTIYSYGGTVFTDYILNFKYVLSNDIKNDDMYTLIDEYNNKYLYKYNYNSSPGIIFEDIPVSDSSSRFEYQNNIYKSLFNKNENIIEYNYYETYNDTILEYDYNLKEDSYVYLNSYYYNNIDYVKVNDKYIYNFDNYIKSLDLHKGKIKIQIYLKNSEYFNLDIGIIKKSDIIKLDSSVIKEDNNYYVNSEKENYLFIPINNIKGINIYNNGKKINVESFIDNFIKIKINEGENNIVVKYKLPLLYIGLILSIIGIILFIINKKIIPNTLILKMSYYIYTLLIILIYLYYYFYALLKNKF